MWCPGNRSRCFVPPGASVGPERLTRLTHVGDPLGESSSHSKDDVDVPLSRAPVRDGRTKRDLAAIDRGAEVDSAVRNDRLTEPPIDFVEFAFGDSSWAIAKAHDVQSRLLEQLEVCRVA